MPPRGPSPTSPRSGLVVRARVADQIIDTMRDRILTGVYQRGSRLPTERELALEYGVSAPTIREVLRALTAWGLVDVRHGSGAYVRTDSDAILAGPLGMLVQLEKVGIEELIGLIQVLNMHAADLALEAATSEDLQRLREAADRTARCRTVDDVQQAVPAFLVAFTAAAHQPLLEALCGFLANLLVRLEMSSYNQRSAGFWRKWASDTAPWRMASVDALEQRDRDQLRAALGELHDGVIERIRAVPALRSAHLSDPALATFVREIFFGTAAVNK